ncbi:MAG: NAD(P)H-quinone oxidoreductase subunit L [Elainellaceae cyanobacterium]
MDILTLALYAVLGGAYLVVIPLAGMFYLNNRWFNASSIERVFMFFCVFMFFPGFLLVSLFLNFRPQRQEV